MLLSINIKMCPESEIIFEDQFVQRIKKNEVCSTAARFLLQSIWMDRFS